MRVELDHFFVCVDEGAEAAADALIGCGLREGAPNTHPGQGTACRRFSFANAMIELFWVADVAEAESDAARRTRLSERWSARRGAASPFGFCMRPVESEAGPESMVVPFPAWQYRPGYLEAPLFMDIGEGGVEEPMWVFMNFMRRSFREQRFVEHPAGVREITGLTLTTPVPLVSRASQVAIENGVLRAREGERSLLEVEFDGGRSGRSVDLTGDLAGAQTGDVTGDVAGERGGDLGGELGGHLPLVLRF